MSVGAKGRVTVLAGSLSDALFIVAADRESGPAGRDAQLAGGQPASSS